MAETNRLNGKDLINVGVYTAITMIIMFAVGSLNAFPPVYPALMVIWPLVCAIPMMLYYTKIKKFGMLTLTGIIIGAFFFLMGYMWVALVGMGAAGFVGDLVLRFGGYQRFSAHALSYAVYCLGMIAGPLLLWFAGATYWDQIEKSMGAEYVSALQQFMPSWMLYVSIPLLFLSGLVGAFLGRKMLRKHFQRAGIA